MATRWPKRYGKVATTNLNVSGTINHNHVHKLGNPYAPTDTNRLIGYLQRPELPENEPVEGDFTEIDG
jgi:hypothetical protein